MTVVINGTTGVTSVNGSAAAPSVTGADTDTGIVYGTNTLSLATGGTTAVTVDSSQNVGIGTSSPSVKLHVISSSGGLAQFTSSASGAGNVGFSCTNVATPVTGYVGANAFTDNVFGIGTTTSTPLIFVTNGSERGRFDGESLRLGSTGGLGLGGRMTISFLGGGSEYGIVMRPVTNSTNAIAFLNAAGSSVGQIAITSTTTAYQTSSDYRLKEDVAPMTGALATVSQLNPVTYKWKSDGSDGQGFIAHELQEVVPDCVTGEKDGVDEEGNPRYQGIDTSFLVATLTAAIQEQQAIITQLRADVEALKSA